MHDYFKNIEKLINFGPSVFKNKIFKLGINVKCINMKKISIKTVKQIYSIVKC